MWRSAFVALTVAVAVAPVAIAQRAIEWQVQVIGTAATAQFLGGGMGFGLRTSGRTRLAITVSAGDLSREPIVQGDARRHDVAGRAELFASYHLSPFRRRGVSPYAGGGVAVAATSQDMLEYVLLAIGIETAPGGSRGWFAELGIGGGVRGSIGFRIRRR